MKIKVLFIMLILACSLATALQDDDADLLLWLSNDINAGTWSDSKNNGLPSYDCTITGATEISAISPWGTSALSFDGDDICEIDLSFYDEVAKMGTSTGFSIAFFYTGEFTEDDWLITTDNVGLRLYGRSNVQRNMHTFARVANGTTVMFNYDADAGVLWDNDVAYCVTVRVNSTHTSNIQNGTIVSTDTIDNAGFLRSDGAVEVGLMGFNAGNYATGKMSQVTFWNRALTGDDIEDFCETGITVTGGATPQITVSLLDEDNDTYANINEDTIFNVLANYTLDGSALTGSQCNFTANNISAHFSVESDVNTTFSSADDKITVDIDAGFTGLANDLINFEVCRETLPSITLNILVNDTIHKTLDSVIPLCTLGSHEENNITTQYITNRAFNVSLNCPDCTASKRVKIITHPIDRDTLHVERNFNVHTEDLVFKDNLQGYLTPHFYHFTKSGNNTVNVSCNDTSVSQSYDVTDVNLSIEIISINGQAFSNGTIIESTLSTNISIEVSGDIITFLEFNVTYPNGTLIKTTSNETMTLSNTELNLNSIYNISISAVDDENINEQNKGWFQLNDTVFPTITFLNPLQDNTSTYMVNDTPSFQMTFFDLNLFAYQVTVVAPNGSTYANYTATNISGTTFNFNEVVDLLVAGTWQLLVNVTDDHTEKVIPDYSIEYAEDIGKDEMSLTFDSGTKITASQAESFTYQKRLDRYSFTVGYDSKSLPPSRIFYVESDGELYLIHDSKYTAHFVDYKNKKWIDFDGVSSVPIITQINKNKYSVQFSGIANHELTFNSIGGLNLQQGTVEFKVDVPVPTPFGLFNFSLEQQSNVMLLFVLCFLWLGVMTLAFIFKNFGFASFGFFLGIILGFLLASLSIFLTFVMLFLNIVMFIRYAKSFK